MSSDAKNRLFHYSETPPPTAWNDIKDALDKPVFAQKLHQYEATPPDATWPKIAQQLEQPPLKVVSLRTKVFKYAIAAAMLAAVTAGIFYLTNSHAPNLANSAQPAANTANANTPSDTQLQSGSQTITQNGYNETDGERGLVTSVTRSENGGIQFSSRISVANNLLLPEPDVNVQLEEKNLIDTERANRYMIATTATGDAVRLPRKAYSDYACVDVYANSYCKEKIASIQSKMATSVTTDFTDFMDLLNQLQEN